MWKVKNNFYKFMRHITIGKLRKFYEKKYKQSCDRKLDVVYIGDEGFVTPTLASLMSMVVNKDKQTYLNVHIIGVNISAYSEACFRKFNRFKNVTIDVINVENPYDNIQTTHQHVSKAAMLKFKIPNLFPNIDKILYIDGDTIVRHDLSELNKINLKGKYAAVAPDMCACYYNHHKRFKLDKYFNSGVMFLNLRLCRQDGIEGRLVDNKKHDKYNYFMDQDAFNQTFEGKVVWLTPKYNTIMLNDNKTPYSFTEKAKFFGLTDPELYWAYHDASIVHLTNKLKPWKNIEATDLYLWVSYWEKWEKLESRKGLFYKKLHKDDTQEIRFLGIKICRIPLKKHLVNIDNTNTADDANFDGLHICFTEGGGMGDCLLALPFLEHVYNCSPTKIKIDFYCKSPANYSNLPYLNYVGKMPAKITDLSDKKYDAVFQIIRYARFISGDIEKIKKSYPILYKYIGMDEQIAKMGHMRDSLRLFNEYALSLDRKRPEHIDLLKIFKYKFRDAKIDLISNEEKVLSKFKLEPGTYITLSRGADGVFNSNHPKLWPLENYNALIKSIKHDYPKLKIVQIGASESFGVMKGTDKKLLGQTSFEECAAILKNAVFHIGEEGGLVHLNHFVGGKSIVLFGPTSADVYGYPENINITGTCKLGNCYHITSHWSDKCMLGNGNCMRSITPDMIMEKIQEIMYPNTWFKIVDASTRADKDMVKCTTLKHLPVMPKGCNFIFDIDKILELWPETKRFALVFFMGIGDYIFSTRFLELLHQKYPHIKLDAYVSKNSDVNNSPIVADLLKKNPFISKVYMYDGIRSPESFRNYDYSAVYDMVDENTFVLPMIYFHTPQTQSRVHGLCDTFGISVPEIILPPVIYDYKSSVKVMNVLKANKRRMKKVVFVSTTQRSAQYNYKDTTKLVRKLLREGFFVITPEKTKIKSDKLLTINTKQFAMSDTISLLREIKKAGIEMYVLTMSSCFPSICSALNIPCLNCQFFYDDKMSTTYFSDSYVMTHKFYSRIPADKQFLMPVSTYEMNDKFAEYDVDALTECFAKFVNIVKMK